MAFTISDCGLSRLSIFNRYESFSPQFLHRRATLIPSTQSPRLPVIRCSLTNSTGGKTLKTCKNCKTQFDPSLNHPRACRFHTAHFGGETKRKFESVYSGGTMAEFFNIGIAADLKILLTLDVLLHLTPPMMNDVVDNLFSSNNAGFCSLCKLANQKSKIFKPSFTPWMIVNEREELASKIPFQKKRQAII